MFCPNCGKQLNDNARFCTECGYQIKPVQSNTSVRPKKNVQPDSGMQQEQQVQPAPPAAEVPSSLAGMNANAQALPNNKKKAIFIALIVVAAIIVLAFLGIKLFIVCIMGLKPSPLGDTFRSTERSLVWEEEGILNFEVKNRWKIIESCRTALMI